MQQSESPECVLVLLPRELRALPHEAWQAIAEHLALAAGELANAAPPDAVLTLRFRVESV